MSEELFRSTGYATTIAGAAFRAEITFKMLRFWLPDQRRVRSVRTTDLQSVGIETNGYTKLVLKLQRDIMIPTSHEEAAGLVKVLDALLAEKRAVEVRRKQAAEAFQRSRTRHRARAVRGKMPSGRL